MKREANIEEIKSYFNELLESQGFITESDYNEACCDLEPTARKDINTWFMESGIPLKRKNPLENNNYRQKVKDLSKNPDFRKMQTTMECILAALQDYKNRPIASFKNGEYDFFLEIAKSDEEKKAGLEKYEKIDDQEGLLFSWDKPSDVTFHMGKVKFPIDILFLNEDLKIAKIIHNAQPGTFDLWSNNNTKYVLEINGGLCKKYNIALNSTCELLGIK